MSRSTCMSLLAAAFLLASIAMAWSPGNAQQDSGSALPTPPTEVLRVFDRGDSAIAETLKVLAHDLANADTTAFKARYVASEAIDLAAGGGSRFVVRTDFRQGDLLDTDRPLDLAIFGHGFFQVMDDKGTMRYTRRGDFARNANSNIVLRVDDCERMLEPAITIPPDALAIHVDNEGVVSVEMPGQCEKIHIGQLQLALFVNVEGLRDAGGGLYDETEKSGAATLTNPAIHGAGKICQRNLEASNVGVEQTWREFERTLARLKRLRGATTNHRLAHGATF